MAKYSFRIPNADYLGFPATPEAIIGCGNLQQLLDSMDVLVQEVIPRVDA